jgi:uncharacterized membrane protein YsdA (DUF1294 family)/cold shock CspA family protein
VKSWNDERGFGFLEPAQPGPDVFLHVTALPYGSERPDVGRVVTYETELGDNGKARAKAVRYAGAERAPRAMQLDRPLPWSWPRALPLLLFAVAYAAMSAVFEFWPVVPGVYLAMSAITYLFYLSDKSSAQAGEWRVSEGTLHLLSLLCGWPGALVAQQRLRHKTSKAEFQSIFWVTVVLNFVAFFALYVIGPSLIGEVLASLWEQL